MSFPRGPSALLPIISTWTNVFTYNESSKQPILKRLKPALMYEYILPPTYYNCYSDPNLNLKQVKIEEPVPAAYQNQYLHTARFPQ